MAEFLRHAGRPLALGRKLGEGGEGAVWTVEGEPQLCAKIWNDKADWTANAEKAGEIIGLYTPDRAEIAAWPQELVRDGQGRVRGFLMEKLEGWMPAYRGYQTKSRRQWLPSAKFGFLVRLARNVSACVERIHSAEMVIGDINESNLLINGRALAKMIDVDSFQISVDGRVYPCEVAKPEYMAPELLREPEIGRTAEQDLFSLAVLLFQILSFGRHPFAGRPREGDPVELETAVLRGWYAYASGPLIPPPGMDLSWLTDEVRSLFEAALTSRAEDRPRASDWHAALRRLEDSLTACSANEAHEFPAEAEACPFCRLERDLRIGFFGRGVLAVRGEAGIAGRAEELREMIEEGREAFPPAPDFRRHPGRSLLWRERIGGASYRTMPAWLTGMLVLAVQAPMPVTAAVLGASALGAGGLAVSGMPIAQFRLKRRYEVLIRERKELEEKWASVAGSSSLIKAAQEAIAESEALLPGGPRERELEREMMRQVFGPSLLAFLRKSSISASHVDAVTATVERSLREAGIRSIADVSEQAMAKVDGISSRIRSDLLDWRRHLEEHYWATTPHSLPPERLRRLEAILNEDRRRCAESIDRLSRALPDRIATEVAEREQILGRTALIDRELSQIAPEMKALEKAVGGILFLP